MKAYFSSLSQPVNNSQLILFRILFGLIMAAQCVYNIRLGLVRLLYIDIAHNFTFIGFEWLQLLHGPGMYVYFAVMALCSFFVAAGLFYRYSAWLLAFMWTAVYLSHKTLYNNHYYLMVLLCWVMVFMPASQRFSADVKLRLAKPRNQCYRWQIQLFVFQIACVYVFAGVAKLNVDWLHALPLKVTLARKTGFPVFGRFMTNPALPWVVAYGGLLFDLLVVPGLLYKGTRKYFFVVFVLFHFLNGYLFRIGTFPYLAIALVVFFFPSKLFDRVVPLEFRTTELPVWHATRAYKVLLYALPAYVAMQLFLPLRHLLFTGPVMWTEEGNRMSWRMMLRIKTGSADFKIVNRKNDSTWHVAPSAFLNSYQVNDVAVLPDVTWQAAQYLSDKYNKQGVEVSIYAINKVSLNFHSPRLLIDTSCDLAHTKWNVWTHNKWILIYP